MVKHECVNAFIETVRFTRKTSKMNFTNNRLTSLRICKLRAYLEKLIGTWSGCSGWSGWLVRLVWVNWADWAGKLDELGGFYEFRNLAVLAGQ